MSHWLRACPDLPEDPGSFPIFHTGQLTKPVTPAPGDPNPLLVLADAHTLKQTHKNIETKIKKKTLKDYKYFFAKFLRLVYFICVVSAYTNINVCDICVYIHALTLVYMETRGQCQGVGIFL